MRKMNQYKICIVIIILLFIQTNSLSAGLYKERSRFLRDLKWIHIEIINLDKENKERLKTFRNSLKSEVASIFRSADVAVRLTENREDIGSSDYLKIRIHKIVLERTVYLSSIEMVKEKDKNTEPKEKQEKSLRYTDVSDRFESVAPSITDRVTKMVNWYIQK
jgi:hypothetical protein